MLLPHIRRAALLFVFSIVAWRADAALQRGYGSIEWPETFAVLDGVGYFAATEGAEQSNLWRTDGTAEGTRRVSDLAPGATVLHPFVAHGRIAFFVQRGTALSLWEADGNTFETRLVAELGELQPQYIRSAAGVAYFTVPDRNRWPYPTMLWRSDGTAAGTALAAWLPFDVESPEIHRGLLYFRARPTGMLWRSDGTSTGTFSLGANVSEVTTSAGLASVIAAADDDRVFFGSYPDLWKTDGTVEGTTRLLFGEMPNSGAMLHGDLYLLTPRTLYRADRAGGVITIATVAEGWGAHAYGLVSMGEQLYFFKDDGLWTSDGTRAGTRRVLQLPYATSRRARVAGTLLYFMQGEQLWRSDGTVAGTFPLIRLPYEGYDPNPGGMTALGGKLLFVGSEGIHGKEPWISDGTIEGTRLVANISPETELRGSVYDRGTGAPVRAYVFVRDSSSFDTLLIDTDAEGRFSIEGLRDGSYQLEVSPAEAAYIRQIWRNHDCTACYGVKGDPIVATAGSRIYGLDFPLVRGGSIAGRIVDANGKSVNGVHVEVVENTPGRNIVAETVSFGDGEYQTVSSLLPGQEVFVRTNSNIYSGMIYDGVSCAAGCDLAAGKPVTVASGETLTGIDFVVTPYGSISGRILDGVTGEPIAAVAIVNARLVYYQIVAATQAVGGTYELTLHDGKHYLDVRIPGEAYRPAFYPNVPCSEPDCSTLQGLSVSAVPGKTTPGYDIVVMPIGARVAGRVVDGATGAPLAGIPVLVLDASDAVVTRTRTKSDGTYETLPSLRPGTYRVRASPASGHVPAALAREVTVSGTDIVRGVDFALDRVPTVTGAVVDAKTKQPLLAAHVFLTDAAGVELFHVRTDVEGRFSVETPPGTFALHAEKLGWLDQDAQVSVALGETKEVNLALPPACDVTVTPVSPATRAGGQKTLTISAPCAACGFETAPFLTIMKGACNSTTLTLRFDPNSGPPRHGTLVFPGTVFDVFQYGF